MTHTTKENNVDYTTVLVIFLHKHTKIFSSVKDIKNVLNNIDSIVI